MQRRPWTAIGLIIIVILLTALVFLPRDVWNDALIHPWKTLWGSEQQLSATLIDVSQTGDPFVSASRRLLKPFGSVRLIRIYPSEEDDTPSRQPLP